MNKVEIGCPEIVSKELPELLEWLEKHVSKHKGCHPIDMVVLASLAAECCELIVRESWIYNESPDEVFGRMKIWARQMALEISKEAKDDRK
jgi:hypothetical protein